MTFRQLLAREFEPYGRLTLDQLDRLEAHHILLSRWNQRVNLTRIEGLEDSVRFNYCESLWVATRLPAGPLRIADVGSGAGFPGFPIAVFRPECSLTLIESNQRKAAFLREVSRGMSNVRVLPDRAECMQSEFDWVVARAVAPEKVLKLKLAKNFALLVGGEDESVVGHLLRVPWGRKRYLAIVSRGT